MADLPLGGLEGGLPHPLLGYWCRSPVSPLLKATVRARVFGSDGPGARNGVAASVLAGSDRFRRDSLAGGGGEGTHTVPHELWPYLLALVPLSTSLVDFTYEYSAMVPGYCIKR